MKIIHKRGTALYVINYLFLPALPIQSVIGDVALSR